MVTDDPYTVPDGHWEINLAEMSAQSELSRSVSVPYLDANYGWGDRVQLKYEGGLVTESEPGMGTISGMTTSLIGTRIRFLGDEKTNIAASTYPQYQYHGWGTSRNERINLPGDHLFLPLEFARKWDTFAINPEVGYMIGSRGGDEWWYGLLFARELDDGRNELLFEVHGRSELASSNRELFFNVGARMQITEWASLLASIGHTVRSYVGEGATTFTYFGMQIHI